MLLVFDKYIVCSLKLFFVLGILSSTLQHFLNLMSATRLKKYLSLYEEGKYKLATPIAEKYLQLTIMEFGELHTSSDST